MKTARTMLLAATLPAAAAATPISLRISDNYYPFVTAEGQPFFWLADPAWQLIHDLNEAEMHPYFADRGDKLFAVIRPVVLSVHRFDTFIARSLTESASRDFSTNKCNQRGSRCVNMGDVPPASQ